MTTPLLQFGWLDLVTPEPDVAADFYCALFGWQREPFDLETIASYQVFTLDDVPVAGLIGSERDTERVHAAWLPSLLVDDLGEAANRVRELGGEEEDFPVTLPGIGETLVVRDAQLAPLSLLWEESGGDPLYLNSEPGFFCSCDLLTSQLDDAVAFYSALCGWQEGPGDIPHRRSTSFVGHGEIQAGAWEAPGEEGRAWWVPAVRVADVRATVKMAEKLDAQVIVPPISRGRRQWAVLLDVLRTPFAVIQ